MELLRKFEDRGYPTDYLLSRVKGKRSRLISDWDPLVYGNDPSGYLSSAGYKGFVRERSAEGVWRDLTHEYRWIYLRMNEELRGIFGPFFLYHELRVIFICLRHIHGGTAASAEGVLSSSLLSDDMKKVLRRTPDVISATDQIEGAFSQLSGTFDGISALCSSYGLECFERELTSRYLAAVLRGRLHPLMRSFFVLMIDSRNVLALFKFLRLNPRAAPTCIPGGSITEAEYSGIMSNKDLQGVLRLSGRRDDDPPQNIEKYLYRNVTGFLRRAGRDPLGIGPLLDYLWRCSLEVMNLSLLLHGRELDRELIRMEMIL
ncbi:MAG: hypothetical protein EPN25_01650 [Nitrospirae bacterium]|nr:MAG: hypothetical protein EPN25_01650 [Nitrospirota bacterium]